MQDFKSSLYSKHRPKSHHGRGSLGSLSISSLSFLPRVNPDVQREGGSATRDRTTERIILFDRIIFFSFVVCFFLFFYALSGSGVSSGGAMGQGQEGRDGRQGFAVVHADHLGVGVDPEGQFTFSHGIGRIVPTSTATLEVVAGS